MKTQRLKADYTRAQSTTVKINTSSNEITL